MLLRGVIGFNSYRGNSGLDRAAGGGGHHFPVPHVRNLEV